MPRGKMARSFDFGSGKSKGRAVTRSASAQDDGVLNVDLYPFVTGGLPLGRS